MNFSMRTSIYRSQPSLRNSHSRTQHYMRDFAGICSFVGSLNDVPISMCQCWSLLECDLWSMHVSERKVSK